MMNDDGWKDTQARLMSEKAWPKFVRALEANNLPLPRSKTHCKKLIAQLYNIARDKFLAEQKAYNVSK